MDLYNGLVRMDNVNKDTAMYALERAYKLTDDKELQ